MQKRGMGSYGIHDKVVGKVEELLGILRDYSEKKPAIKPLLEKLREERDGLKDVREPTIISKKYIDTALNLLKMLNNAIFILRNNESSITSEDIRAIVKDVLVGLSNYRDTVRREHFKSSFTVNVPIYVAATTFVIALLYHFYTFNYIPMIDVLVVILGLIGLALSHTSPLYAYLFVFIGSVIGLFTVKIEKPEFADFYLITIYLLVILTSGFYFQIMRSLSSGRIREKITELLNEFESIDRRLREAPLRKESSEEVLRIKAMEEKLRKVFLERYGPIGELLLKYKVNVMVMHGKSREDVVKHLLKQYSHSSSDLS